MTIDQFTAVCSCPKCGAVDVHLIQEPNPEEPELVEAERIQMFGGLHNSHRVIYEYSHQDERDWGVARVCTCGHRWGQQ